MSKDLVVQVKIKYDDFMDKDELRTFELFADRSTDAIKRKLVDELVTKFAATVTLDDLDFDLSDVATLVKQRIIDKAAEAAVDALGIRNND